MWGRWRCRGAGSWSHRWIRGVGGGLRTFCVEGDVAGGSEEPAGEDGRGVESGGFSGEEEEDGLGDVLGEVLVAELADGAGVDEVDVAVDEGGGGALAGGLGEVAGGGPDPGGRGLLP